MAQSRHTGDGATGIRAVAERLQKLRETLGFTQSAMSSMIGGTERGQTWQNYEAGRRLIAVPHALALCQRLGITLDWIYRGNVLGLPPELRTKLLNSKKSGRAAG